MIIMIEIIIIIIIIICKLTGQFRKKSNLFLNPLRHNNF